MRFWVVFVVYFVGRISVAISQTYPFEDPTLPWDTRVNDLVKRLTLDEVTNQSIATNRPPVGIPRLNIRPYQWNRDCLRGYTDYNATAFPQALGLAATFSREVIFNMTTAISSELRAFYNNDVKRQIYGQNGLSCLSPVINIMRNPLWGRSQETYGEDPYLTGQLVAQYVRGLQGNHPRYVKANAGCKHFAAYAGPEDIPSSRFSFDAKVSQRDLRMTFLPQFKTCVEAGTYNIMCSYSSVNGIPACLHKNLLTDVLRKEWNFKGFVISDDDAIQFAVTAHKYLSTPVEAVSAAIRAGCNMELSDEAVYFQYIPQAISKGLLNASEVFESLKPVIYTRMRLGEFDPVAMNPYSSIDMSVVLSDEHRELAVQAATMSFVLLKNLKQYLPIKKRFKQLAIVGPMANDASQLFGDYTPYTDRKFVTTPYQGLKNLSDDTRFAAGCDDTRCQHYDGTTVEKAVVGADLVIVCLGNGIIVECEGKDRSDLTLPGDQLQLLKDAIFFNMIGQQAPLLLLIFTAGPIDLTFAQESSGVDAIVQCFYPAQATGDALYRILTMTGPRSVPAGRLPSTWPAQLRQFAPITDYNMLDGQTYRYWKDDPLYPFGFGLSYSAFDYMNLTLSSTSIKAGENVTAAVTVVNRGPFNADEVIQVYLSWMQPKVPVPRWTLVGFDRPSLVVGIWTTFFFNITSEQMAVWLDDKTGFSVQPGEMVVYAGGQQPFQRVNAGSNILQSTFTIVT